jgi:hypothetical protein
MKNVISNLSFILISFILFFIFISKSESNDKTTIQKNSDSLRGTFEIYEKKLEVTPIPLPINSIYHRNVNPSIFNNPIQVQESVLFTSHLNEVLQENQFSAYEFDINNSKINLVKPQYSLTNTSLTALEQAPNWLYDQLKLKLIILNKYNLDSAYSQLILDASENIKDEVAFLVANMSYQTLTDPRFSSDKQLIIRNAQQIYQIADSLQYVKLVEHGTFLNKDYYTTTSYRIYDSTKNDTIWSEIPKEYYYWYIVHPKLAQEGVYVIDNEQSISQRTYNYSWREFIWFNPDSLHDYSNVNITTNKGTVTTIPRFGELMKTPKILWDRKKTTYRFSREMEPENSALDLIGNWCSRAIPVDVVLPRALQTNQVLMKHNGMCGEDAQLTVAACRTALIPSINLLSATEDHTYGSIWDQDWNHFEFFRGGLQPNGNSSYGLTNLQFAGGFGWRTSMVEGARPDGFVEDFTKYYANICYFDLTVTDAVGTPIDGAMVEIYAPYSTGFDVCSHQYTNKRGKVHFQAGELKQYLVKIYHPLYGWSPVDSTKAYILVSSAQRNMTYNGDIPYLNLKLDTILPENINLPDHGNFGFRLKFQSQEIVSGINQKDWQRSRFYKWNADSDGIVTIFVCDSINFNKFQNKQSFSCYQYIENANGGEITHPFPDGNKWYLVIQNKSSANISEKISATCDLLSNPVLGIEEKGISDKITIFPNPFNVSCFFSSSEQIKEIKIFNSVGILLTVLSPPFKWEPKQDIDQGLYFAKISTNKGSKYEKLIFLK